MLSKKLLLLMLVWCVGLPAFALGQKQAPPGETGAPFQSIEDSLKSAGKNVDITLWVGAASGGCAFERGARTVMPTASAIKTFYLVELFAKHGERLDEPVPDAKQILKDDHPAISHFTPDVRNEIRRELLTASVRRVGQIMQGRTTVSNEVYNGAANLVTAHLGGPKKLTELIHARDPRFKSVIVRRYMLRDRTKPGDNDATAESFAALYQAIASRKLNGISDDVMTAIHEILRRPGMTNEPIFEKDGSLGSNPLTSVRAGWRQTAGGPVIFVVMGRQPIANQAQSEEAYKQLQAQTASLRDQILRAGRSARPKEVTAVLEHTSDSLDTVRANLKGQKAVLLDVRDRDEWDEGHLADAKLLPLGQLRKPNADELLQSVPRDKIVYTHCARGKRALDAGQILKAKGYDVRPLSPGFDELLKNGFEKAK
jgi:rhodanese-related sulfurtransferase